MNDKRKSKQQLLDELSQLRQRVTDLESAEARYHQLFENAAIGIFHSLPEGRFLQVNPALARMLGYASPEEMVSTVTNINTQIYVDSTRRSQLLAATLNTAGWLYAENRYRRKDGSVMTANLSVRKELKPDGTVAYLEGFVEDITERKQAEAALRESEETTRALLDAMPEAGMLLEPDGTILVANEAMMARVSYRMDEFLGKNIASVFPPEIAAARTLKAEEVIRTGQAVHFTDSRTGHWLDNNIFPIFDAHHQVTRLAIYSRDITEHKQAQEALARHVQTLAALYETSLEINSQPDVPALLNAIVRRAAELLGVQRGGLYLMQPDGQTLKLVVDHQLPGHYLGVTLRLGEGLAGRVAQTGQALMVDDYQHWEHRAPVYDGADLRRVLGVPMKMGGRVIGVIDITDSQRVGPFSDEEVQLASLFADQAAIAVEKARLFEAAQLRRQELEAVYEASLSLTRSLDLPQVFDSILRAVLGLVPACDTHIFLYDGHALTFGAALSKEGPMHGPFTEPRLDGLTYQVARSGEVIVVEDNRRHPLYATSYTESEPFAIIGLPLKMGVDVVGVMNVAYAAPRHFEAAELHVMNLLAAQAAIAVHNAHLHDQVQQYAGQLEQHVAERTAELERERNQTRAILDSIGEGIYVMNLAGKIEYVNPALERLTGYNLAEMRGHSGLMWRSGLTAQAVINDLDRHVMRGEAWQGEVVNRRQDGGLYTTATTIAPIKDGDQTVGIVGVQRDISHLKELDRLKDQFVTRIGHELRTPVTNLRLYLDLIKHGRPDKYDQYLQILTLESERLRRLVNGFLEIAEYDTSTTPRLTAVDLNQVAVELIADQHPVSLERGQSLGSQLAPNLPMGLADPVWIRSAVRKLMINALDYTPQGGQVNVTTAVRKTQDQREWITLTVQDSGPGLSPEEMPHIFERFYRGKAANNYSTPGVGLGLSISQAIVEKLGGRITVESQTGQGATFTIWIRAAE